MTYKQHYNHDIIVGEKYRIYFQNANYIDYHKLNNYVYIFHKYSVTDMMHRTIQNLVMWGLLTRYIVTGMRTVNMKKLWKCWKHIIWIWLVYFEEKKLWNERILWKFSSLIVRHWTCYVLGLLIRSTRGQNMDFAMFYVQIWLLFFCKKYRDAFWTIAMPTVLKLMFAGRGWWEFL